MLRHGAPLPKGPAHAPPPWSRVLCGVAQSAVPSTSAWPILSSAFWESLHPAGAKCEAGTAEVVGCGPGMLEGGRNWALLPLLPAAKVSSEPGSSCLFSALLESEVI